MSELAGFSDWMLAVLPRLFVYPGGAWMLATLVMLRFVLGGRRGISPKCGIHDLFQAQLFSTTLAWTALALAPLPGTAMLPFPIDRLVLAGLVAASLACDQVSGGEGGYVEAPAGIAITLALVAPLAGERALLSTGGSTWTLADWLSTAAVLIGLGSLAPTVKKSVAGGARWLAWLGLALAPVWAQSFVPGAAGVSLGYLLLIPLVAWSGKVICARGDGGSVLVLTAWGFALIALLVALLI